jgi:nucleoporin POM152
LDGLAQRITVPLSIKYNDIGTHTYRLDAITDGLGNVVQLNDLKEMKEMEVIARPSFHFHTSVTGQPAPLLLGPVPETKLPITSLNLDIQRSNWTLEILNRETGHKETVSTKTSTSALLVYSARRPGTYEIIGARGDYCQGTILTPETWRVIEQPLPQVNVSWRELHEWSVEIVI